MRIAITKQPCGMTDIVEGGFRCLLGMDTPKKELTLKP